MAAEGLPVQVACRTLSVSEAGYYAHLIAAPSERSIRHAWLTDVIRQVHLDSRGTYGSRRVHAELTLGHGLVVGYEQVTLLMRRAGIQGLSGRPGGSGHRSLSRPLTWWTGSSPATDVTCCGCPISPNIPPARAGSTARSFSTSTRGGWSGGPSTPRRPPRW
jgi:hypothetical protein